MSNSFQSYHHRIKYYSNMSLIYFYLLYIKTIYTNTYDIVVKIT